MCACISLQLNKSIIKLTICQIICVFNFLLLFFFFNFFLVIKNTFRVKLEFGILSYPTCCSLFYPILPVLYILSYPSFCSLFHPILPVVLYFILPVVLYFILSYPVVLYIILSYLL
uniref:Uncharacterized protein n=1 Tax=Cacopsylla melanoneura TaxID=428564 RepID=A0A8D8WB05_9HEMI